MIGQFYDLQKAYLSINSEYETIASSSNPPVISRPSMTLTGSILNLVHISSPTFQSTWNPTVKLFPQLALQL